MQMIGQRGIFDLLPEKPVIGKKVLDSYWHFFSLEVFTADIKMASDRIIGFWRSEGKSDFCDIFNGSLQMNQQKQTDLLILDLEIELFSFEDSLSRKGPQGRVTRFIKSIDMPGMILLGFGEVPQMIVQFSNFIVNPQLQFVQIVYPSILQSLFQNSNSFYFDSAFSAAFSHTHQ